MKKCISTATLLLTMGLAVQAEAIPTFYFDFNGDTLADSMIATTVGDSFTADVFIGGIDNYYDGIVGASVDVLYDSALADVTASQVDPIWELNLSAPPAAGVVPMDGGMFVGALFNDPLPLGSITFTSTAAGMFDLVLADRGASFESLAALDGSGAHIYDPDIIFESASVNVSAVPLPGAVFLLGSGLAGIMGLRRKMGRG